MSFSLQGYVAKDISRAYLDSLLPPHSAFYYGLATGSLVLLAVYADHRLDMASSSLAYPYRELNPILHFIRMRF